MNASARGISVPAAWLLLTFLSLLPPGPAAEEGCTSGACHAGVVKAATVHAATESCDTCHEALATPHPQAGVKTFKLSQDEPALCVTCHEAPGTKPHVHSPVKDGQCTTCHNPHASDQPRLLVQPVKDLCESCHGDQSTAKHPHGPVSAGDCTSCHAPHESEFEKLALKQGDDLCLGCHVDMADVRKKGHVHAALEMGCASCHSPHGADFPKLLAAPGGQLCFQCHDTIEQSLAKATSVHPPVEAERACVTCHSPHGSDTAALLLKPQKETCLECHKSILTREMTVLHGPVRDGQCVACHDPHASANAKLLSKPFPPGPYVPYTGTSYALCFTCHNRDLLAYPDTSSATGFRDGDRNLHYLHVNKGDKGRSCRLCHDFHGADNAKLLARTVPFAKWSLPLKFVKTETGGGCSPGCHKPLWYDREVPGRKPQPAVEGARP